MPGYGTSSKWFTFLGYGPASTRRPRENAPSSSFRLENNGYLHIGKMLARPGVPVLFVLEGGYSRYAGCEAGGSGSGLGSAIALEGLPPLAGRHAEGLAKVQPQRGRRAEAGLLRDAFHWQRAGFQ